MDRRRSRCKATGPRPAAARRQPGRRGRRDARRARSRSPCSAILVWSVFSRGVARAQPGLLHEGPGASSARRAAGSRPRSSARLLLVGDRDRDRAAGRRPDRDLRQRVRAAAARRPGAPLARRPERLPVDRDRDLRLHADGQDRRADPRLRPPPERVGRRVRARRSSCCRSSRGRRWRCSRSSRTAARGELRARRLEVADRAARRRCRPRSAASSPGTTLAVARAAGETAPLLFTCSIAGQT